MYFIILIMGVVFKNFVNIYPPGSLHASIPVLAAVEDTTEMDAEHHQQYCQTLWWLMSEAQPLDSMHNIF